MNIDFNAYTEMSALAVQEAQSLARKHGNSQIDVWHLLSALLKQEKGIVSSLLEKLSIAPSAVLLSAERELAKLPIASVSVNVSQVYLTQDLQKALTGAEKAKAKLGDDFVSTEHLLLGLFDVDSDRLNAFWGSFDLDEAKVLKALKEARGNQKVTSRHPESTFEALAKYGIDLVDQARSGKMDPVIGRDDEIRRVIRILSRKTKNNPVLIGEPESGNHIVEGLAQRLSEVTFLRA